LYRVPLLKSETRGTFLHLVEPLLDHMSLLAVVEPGTLVILPTALCQVELKLLQADEQRGSVLREEDRWLLLLAAAAVLLTLVASQGDIEPSWLW